MKLKTILSLIVCAGCFLANAAAQSSSQNRSLKFDGHRLRTGTFEYHDFTGSKDLGTSRIVIDQARGSDVIRFSSVVSGSLSERWQAVAKLSFEPISASLSFGEAQRTPAFRISYKRGRVTGFMVERKGPKTGAKHAIDESLGPDIVDQRIDWAAVSASDFGAGPEFEFDVYDPGIGISHVLARHGSAQSVRVPAGEFEVHPITYEIAKRSGTEVYTVFVTRDPPRILVREDFPNGVESELVVASPEQR